MSGFETLHLVLLTKFTLIGSLNNPHGDEDDNVFLESFDWQFEGSWWQVGCYTSIQLEQYNFKLIP